MDVSKSPISPISSKRTRDTVGTEEAEEDSEEELFEADEANSEEASLDLPIEDVLLEGCETELNAALEETGSGAEEASDVMALDGAAEDTGILEASEDEDTAAVSDDAEEDAGGVALSSPPSQAVRTKAVPSATAMLIHHRMVPPCLCDSESVP